MSEVKTEYRVTKQDAQVLLELVRGARIKDEKVRQAEAEYSEKRQAALKLAKDLDFPRYCTVNDGGREYIIHFGNSMNGGFPSCEIIEAERFEEGG